MSEITLESVAKDLSEITAQVGSLKDRLAQVDNQSRGNDSALREIVPSLDETHKSLEVLNLAMQNLFYTQSHDQIIIEAVVRYMAGYQQGDFTKEMETVSDQLAAGQEPEGFVIKPRNDFDTKRFYDIAEEIGASLKQMREKKLAESRAKAIEDQKNQARKPKIEIVQSLPKDL